MVLSVAGMALLPRKRVAFFGLLCLAVYNLFPAMRVFMPSTAVTVLAGTEVTMVQVRWEEDSTHSLETKLNSEVADIAVVTGVDEGARESLLENLQDWPYSMSSPSIEDDDAHALGTIVFSKHPLLEPEVICFAENTILMEARLDLYGPPVTLRVVNLPPPGPGDREQDREALLNDLEGRPWDLRTIFAIDLGASDTSMAYDRIRGLGDFVDARQGIGRQATFAASFGGFALPGMSVPREFTFVGGEIGVIERFSESIVAKDRERPLYSGDTHNTTTTRVRIVH